MADSKSQTFPVLSIFHTEFFPQPTLIRIASEWRILEYHLFLILTCKYITEQSPRGVGGKNLISTCGGCLCMLLLCHGRKKTSAFHSPKPQFSTKKEKYLKCSALVNAGDSAEKKRITGQNFAACIFISFSRDRFIGKWDPFSSVGQARRSTPLLCALHPRPKLKGQPVTWAGDSSRGGAGLGAGNRHCQRYTRSAPSKSTSQDAEKPGKGNHRDFQQKFVCFLVCFKFFPKSIVILMNWHLQAGKKIAVEFLTVLSRSQEPGKLSRCISFNKGQ